MKNGKLFGKINLIDLLVAVAAILIVGAVALKVTGNANPARVDVGTTIHYTAKAEGIDPLVYEDIKKYIEAGKAAGFPGDQLMANGELVNGYVTGVTATPHKIEATVYTTGGMSVVGGRDDLVDLVFDIEAVVSSNIKTDVGTQEVRSGKPHIVKTTHFELQYCSILTCEWEGGTGAGY